MKRIILICSIVMLPVFMFLVPSASQPFKDGDKVKPFTFPIGGDGETTTVFLPEKAAELLGGESGQIQIIQCPCFDDEKAVQLISDKDLSCNYFKGTVHDSELNPVYDANGRPLACTAAACTCTSPDCIANWPKGCRPYILAVEGPLVERGFCRAYISDVKYYDLYLNVCRAYAGDPLCQPYVRFYPISDVEADACVATLKFAF